MYHVRKIYDRIYSIRKVRTSCIVHHTSYTKNILVYIFKNIHRDLYDIRITIWSVFTEAAACKKL